MKRTIQRLTALLCALVLLTLSAGAAFQDVPEGYWAEAAIERCAAAGWLRGKSADAFGVGQPMTRAAFVVALSRFFGWESGGTAYRVYADVPEGAWYEPALRACYEHGAVTRQTAEFRPDDPITREELAVMLVRALGYGPIAGLAEEDDLPFRDVETNRGHIAMAYELGLSGGISADSFAPSRSATREQAAVMLTRLADRLTAPETEETMAILRKGESLPQLDGCQTLVLMCGSLVSGQRPRLAAELSDVQAEALSLAREAGGQVLLGVSGQSGILKSGDAAGTLLAEAVEETGCDGVYLELAQPRRDDGRELTAFVEAVRAALPEALVYVTADAPVRGGTAKDYTALGQAADRIVLQVPACVDEDAAVPVLAMEPLENIYYALSVLNDQVPADRLALYLTAEGQAQTGGKSAVLDGAAVAELAEKGTVYYSDRYDCAYLRTKKDGTVVWYLNGQALEARRQLLNCFGVSTVCLSTLNGTLSLAEPLSEA